MYDASFTRNRILMPSLSPGSHGYPLEASKDKRYTSPASKSFIMLQAKAFYSSMAISLVRENNPLPYRPQIKAW